MGAFGWLVDRFLIERIRHQGEEPGILLTIGLSIFLANTALLAVGTAPLKVEAPICGCARLLRSGRAHQAAPVRRGGVRAADRRRPGSLIHKTRLGRAMRATFQDPMAARLVGVRTANVYAATFAMGTVIASMAGMLLGSIYSAQVAVGGLVSMKAFVVVILGGMGSFAGAIAGGLLLGVAEALWGGYVATGWVDIIGFALVILMLRRPALRAVFARRAERA